jgi:hypothetical protein
MVIPRSLRRQSGLRCAIAARSLCGKTPICAKIWDIASLMSRFSFEAHLTDFDRAHAIPIY